jgi:hypothetical protein
MTWALSLPVFLLFTNVIACDNRPCSSISPLTLEPGDLVVALARASLSRCSGRCSVDQLIVLVELVGRA